MPLKCSIVGHANNQLSVVLSNLREMKHCSAIGRVNLLVDSFAKKFLTNLFDSPNIDKLSTLNGVVISVTNCL